MAKYVSAKTGKVTYIGEAAKPTPTVTKSVSAKTGEITYSTPTTAEFSVETKPSIDVKKTVDIYKKRLELAKEREAAKPVVTKKPVSSYATFGAETTTGADVAPVTTPVVEAEKPVTTPVVEAEKFERYDVKDFDKPKPAEYQPATLWDVKDIGQVPGVLGRSLQSSVEFLFPITKGAKYSQEELRSIKPGETQQEFEDRMGLQRGFWSGVSLVATAIPTVAYTKAAAAGGGGIFAGVGSTSIYAAKGAGTVALEKAAALPVIEPVVGFLGKHVTTRAALGFGAALIAPDVASGLSETVTEKPKTKTTLTKEEEKQIIQTSFQEASYLVEFEKVEKGERTITAEEAYIEQRTKELKEQGVSSADIHKTIEQETAPEIQTAPPGYEYPGGKQSIAVPKNFYFEDTKEATKVIRDVEYKATVPGIDVPFLGYLSPYDLIPAQQVMPFGMGEKYSKDFQESAVRQLKEKGYSDKEAKDYAKYLDTTQREARGVGEVAGLVSIGVAEEAISQSLLKTGIESSGKVGLKALTKKQAAKLVKEEIGVPLLIAGFAGGASSMVVEQRAQAQDLDPILIGVGGVTGAVSAYALGVPIATKAYTNPTQSKVLYGLGSILDPLEAPSDWLESKIARKLGQSELRLPIITTTTTLGGSTPSMGAASTTPSVAVTAQETVSNQEISQKDWKVGTKIKDIGGVSSEITAIKPVKGMALSELTFTTSETPSTTLTPTSTTSKKTTVTPSLTQTLTPSTAITPTTTVSETSSFTPTPSVTETITPSFTETPTPTPTESDAFTNTFTEVFTESATPAHTATVTPTTTTSISSTFTPTFTAQFLPFLPPIGGIGGGGTGGKGSRRDRTRFIDEFSLAFAGLATPGQPVSFGKKGKSNTKTK